MLNAIDMLNADPAQIARRSSENVRYILQGTRLRDVLLRHSPLPAEPAAPSHEPPGSQEPATILDHDLPDAHAVEDVEAEVEAELQHLAEHERTPLSEHASALMSDQRIQSWARRYSHPNPIAIPGDPVLKLNSTQVRAIALMLASRVSLVQGVRLSPRRFHRADGRRSRRAQARRARSSRPCGCSRCVARAAHSCS